MIEETMMEKRVWAVVGANIDPEKYGNMIYKRLKSKGYEVYAINPFYDEIEGDKCYESLSELPTVPEVINMVVSPKRGISYVEEASKLGIRYIWLQPGTYDNELLNKINHFGLEAAKACVLVAVR